MQTHIRIGTRESQLAVWQATLVQNLLQQQGYQATLEYIKSDGDIDLKTPLYEMGVQGIFTRSLDIALLNGSIDIAVHSMKDVPTQLPKGIVTAAVLERANYKDVLVYKGNEQGIKERLLTTGTPLQMPLTIATSSIRRKAQWLHRYPGSIIENLRGNVNTRLHKVEESNWDGAIFAAAGLERINLLPATSIELDWMLPAPAQGAIMIVCRENALQLLEACALLHHHNTAICTQIERDFLRALMGGCSTPISALVEIKKEQIIFKGSIAAVDGSSIATVEKTILVKDAENLGIIAAKEILQNGGQAIAEAIQHA